MTLTKRINFALAVMIAIELLKLGLAFKRIKTVEYRQTKEFEHAKDLFDSQYPNTRLISYGNIESAWVFTYTDGATKYQAVKLGEIWLQVIFP